MARLARRRTRGSDEPPAALRAAVPAEAGAAKPCAPPWAVVHSIPDSHRGEPMKQHDDRSALNRRRFPPDHGGRRAGRASRRRCGRASPRRQPESPGGNSDGSARHPGQLSGHRGARLPEQRRGGAAADTRPRRPPRLRRQQDAAPRRRLGRQGGGGRALPLRRPVRRRRGRGRPPLLHQRGREHHRERDGLAAGRQRGRGRAALRHHLRALPRARAPGGGRTADHPVARTAS